MRSWAQSTYRQDLAMVSRAPPSWSDRRHKTRRVWSQSTLEERQRWKELGLKLGRKRGATLGGSPRYSRAQRGPFSVYKSFVCSSSTRKCYAIGSRQPQTDRLHFPFLVSLPISGNPGQSIISLPLNRFLYVGFHLLLALKLPLFCNCLQLSFLAPRTMGRSHGGLGRYQATMYTQLPSKSLHRALTAAP